MEVSVSLVTFKTSEEEVLRIRDCLRASELSIDWTIVDNSPDDRLREVAEQAASRYIFAGKNLGFGRAHNLAFDHRSQRAAFHVVMNPDVDFNSGVLKALAKRMAESPELGLIMPKVVYPSGELQRVFKLLPRPRDLIFRRFSPIKSLVEKNNRLYEMHFMNPNESFEAPSLSGCFMFLRADTFEKLKGFDERYFMYLEDVDLSRRIGAVARTLYYPAVSIRHAHGRGSYKSPRLLWYHIVSAIRYFNKWGWFLDREREQVNSRARMKEAA